MKFLTYIIAGAALVFGLNTTNAATIENSNAAVEAAMGTVEASMDRNGILTIDLKSDQLQRAFIQLQTSRGAVVYESVVIVDSAGQKVQIQMDQFDPGVLTLTVKGDDLKYVGRFKNK